jgi:hypothetical protein
VKLLLVSLFLDKEAHVNDHGGMSPVRILVTLAALQQVLFPIFVNPFTSSTRPIQASTPSQLVPAGYAFAIWTPIYLLALCFGIWQLTANGRNDAATLRMAPLAIALYAGSSVWLYCAKYGPLWVTMPILAAMAACAMSCLLIALQDRGRTGLSWWFVVLPFALYAGWTVCATFVNIAEVAPGYGFARFGLGVVGYALLSLAVVSCIAIALVWASNANVPFAATIIWALVGIAVAGVSRSHSGAVVAVAISAVFAILLTVLVRRFWPSFIEFRH